MAIQKSDKVVKKIRLGSAVVSIPLWTGKCDSCSTESNGFNDPSAAHEQIWKAGWRPIEKGWCAPMAWHCNNCMAKKTANGKN